MMILNTKKMMVKQVTSDYWFRRARMEAYGNEKRDVTPFKQVFRRLTVHESEIYFTYSDKFTMPACILLPVSFISFKQVK
jgi:hypothetical protein